jgi:Tfp pilus assembly protein PilF
MRYLLYPILIFFLPLCWSKESIADKNCPVNQGAKLDSVQGKVFVDPGNKGQWHQAQLEDFICEGSRIRVETYSRASITLTNGVVLRLDEGTVLSLNGISPDKPTLLDLLNGFIHFISRTPKHLEITSPIANAGPEGTEFAMRVDDKKASLWVYEGAVKFFNDKGSVHLKPGEGALALLGQAPKTQIDIKPQDAVNWALYYPPILPYPEAAKPIDPEIRAAIQNFRQGHVDDALIRLDALSPAKRSPYFFKIRGAIRLTAGRVPLALQDIQVLLITQPNDAEALALQSVLALTQNRKEEAYTLANRAIMADSHSASAFSALSYTEQARFQLDKALEAADQAAKIAPHDAMVWARKAELELSKGLTSESRQTSKRALELDADLERTQTVTGFSYLLRMDTDEALQAFEKAVKLDSTSPLARLGLGLAKIRKGDLKEGRQDLEIAAILDPNNSLVRSYLGKAYYEEKRSSLAEDQFGLAKERDPKDPTPYFYDAINKQTTNRPVEALHDMQKAIDLNDNRAVYRSSLLLDKDLAARSAAQGRIYNDLGFHRLGLLEGWKSVNSDPTNYSAHRLLADNYASQPRHEIARVSELLQSQLLQPINITPIQPQLAQSNILIVDGLGPSSLSFNEFNPLFARNRFALQASGVYGSNNTWGEDVVHSGLWDKASYSLGQFHYETDGFRKNNYLNQDIYNAFVQGNVTNTLNLQAEYRHEERKNGDLSINFDPNLFSSLFKENRNIDTYRLGGRYIFSPKSSFLGSLIYQDVDIHQKDIVSGIPIRIAPVDDRHLQRRGYISELQHQYSSSGFNLISGFGHIDQTVNLDTIRVQPGRSPRTSLTISDITRINLYNYSNFNFADQITATFGLSYEHLKIKNQFQRNLLNPKFGLVLKPISSTTVRLAAFRGMNITRTANQSIEPTHVAGFNQLFDDPDGTVALRYGGGIDYKFSKNVSIGLEYTERKLNVPFGISAPLDWKEKLGKAYLYITPYNFVSISAEYFYEKFDRKEYKTTRGINNFQTENHWIPLTISLFHPSGFSFMVKGTYFNQSGVFKTAANTESPGNSDFYIIDLNINYRLPSRNGIISFGVKNLFDDRIQYQDINSTQSNSNENFFAPDLTLFTRLKLAY